MNFSIIHSENIFLLLDFPSKQIMKEFFQAFLVHCDALPLLQTFNFPLDSQPDIFLLISGEIFFKNFYSGEYQAICLEKKFLEEKSF